MRAVIQAVSSASVRVEGGEPRAIGPGIMILLGVKDTDTLDIVPKLADKCAGLRIFPDAEGKLNLSARDLGYSALVVSQFTLYGDTRKGYRPSFIKAAKPPLSVDAYELFLAEMAKHGLKDVQHGEFGAHMQVSLVNEGPCTIIIDTDEWKKKEYGKGIELQGKTLGIVGFGRIGQHLGVMAKAIGMNVVAFARHPNAELSERLGIPYVSMDELLASSDFISLHAPAVDGGALVSAETIAKMKDGVVIINTSRGSNVDEDALLAALESGKVRAAGLDVYVDEPTKNKALYSHPMVSCTPHIGAATVEAQKRIGAEIVEIIKAM